MTKVKDKRYKTVRLLITSGHIHSFDQIFEHIPVSTVNKDFGTNYQRFSKMIATPELFRLRELYVIAKLFEVDEKVIVELAHAQATASKKKRKP